MHEMLATKTGGGFGATELAGKLTKRGEGAFSLTVCDIGIIIMQ